MIFASEGGSKKTSLRCFGGFFLSCFFVFSSFSSFLSSCFFYLFFLLLVFVQCCLICLNLFYKRFQPCTGGFWGKANKRRSYGGGLVRENLRPADP